MTGSRSIKIRETRNKAYNQRNERIGEGKEHKEVEKLERIGLSPILVNINLVDLDRLTNTFYEAELKKSKNKSHISIFYLGPRRLGLLYIYNARRMISKRIKSDAAALEYIAVELTITWCFPKSAVQESTFAMIVEFFFFEYVSCLVRAPGMENSPNPSAICGRDSYNVNTDNDILYYLSPGLHNMAQAIPITRHGLIPVMTIVITIIINVNFVLFVFKVWKPWKNLPEVLSDQQQQSLLS
ncbi:hypothetical protein ACJX0J_010715 [Zea mays]